MVVVWSVLILLIFILAASYVCATAYAFSSQNRQKKIFSACRTRSSMPRIGKR